MRKGKFKLLSLALAVMLVPMMMAGCSSSECDNYTHVPQSQVTFRTVHGIGEPFGAVTSAATIDSRIVVTVPADTTQIVANLGGFFMSNEGMRGADFRFTGRVNEGAVIEGEGVGAGRMLERVTGGANPGTDYRWRPVGNTGAGYARDHFSNFVMYWYADADAGDLRDEVHLFLNVPADVTHEDGRRVEIMMYGDNGCERTLDLEIRRVAPTAD